MKLLRTPFLVLTLSLAGGWSSAQADVHRKSSCDLDGSRLAEIEQALEQKGNELQVWREAWGACPSSPFLACNLAAALLRVGEEAEAGRVLAKVKHACSGELTAYLERPETPPKAGTWSFRRVDAPPEKLAAVVIGNGNYQEEKDKVPFAHNDAQAMEQFLVEGWGVRKSWIDRREDATTAVFNQILNYKLKDFVDEGATRLFFYYSGHGDALRIPGTQRHEAAIVAADAQQGAYEGASVPLSQVVMAAAKAGFKELDLVVDACYIGGLDDQARPLTRPADGFEQRLAQTQQGIKVRFVSASERDQFAYGDPGKGHGLLTWHLLLALSGRAPQLSNITLADLKDWLRENVNREANRLHKKSQRPVLSGEDRALLASYPQRLARGR